MNITAKIGQRSRMFVALLALGLLLVAVALRYLIPPRFSVAFIFLLPISFATWFVSWAAGAVIAVIGVIFLFYFDLRFTHSGSASLYWNVCINLIVAATFIYIFSELRALYQRQLNLSRRDSLTGLLNRRAFVEMLTLENNRMARHHRPLTLAYIDLDNFKQINDEYGHAVGDEFLIGVGNQMGTRLRVTDYLARLGGDEFAILLPETDQVAARLVLNQIQGCLLRFAAEHRAVTVSIGAVTFTSSEHFPDTMIVMADKAMYEVKEAGKNNIAYRLAG